jgi:hypothetical protein
MTFTGYCSALELARFLGFGNWRSYPINGYDHTQIYTLPTVSDDGNLNYIISGSVSLMVDGVLYDADNYSVDFNTGTVTFTTRPDDESTLVFFYYINREYDDNALNYYTLLASRRLEKDSAIVLREIETTYTTDGNQGTDYIHITNQNTLELPYNILSVEELIIDGQNITPSTVKIKGNTLCLTNDSEKKYFSGKADSVVANVVCGIPEEEDDHTEEQLRLLDFAKEATLCMAAIMIIDSPTGRNTRLDNDYVVQRSDGSVRPDLTVQAEMIRYEKKYSELLNLLQASTVSTI